MAGDVLRNSDIPGGSCLVADRLSLRFCEGVETLQMSYRKQWALCSSVSHRLRIYVWWCVARHMMAYCLTVRPVSVFREKRVHEQERESDSVVVERGKGVVLMRTKPVNERKKTSFSDCESDFSDWRLCSKAEINNQFK